MPIDFLGRPQLIRIEKDGVLVYQSLTGVNPNLNLL
jgi:hypothetical protein